MFNHKVTAYNNRKIFTSSDLVNLQQFFSAKYYRDFINLINVSSDIITIEYLLLNIKSKHNCIQLILILLQD